MVVVFDAEGEIDEVNEYSTVAKAIKALSNEGKDYEGELHILFKDGVATSVILTDVAVEEEKKPSGTVEWIDKDAGNNYSDPTYYVESGATPTNVEDEIYAMLVAEKCTDIIYDSADGWTFTKSNGMTVKNQNITAVQVYKVSFDTDEVTLTGGLKMKILSADTNYAAASADVVLKVSVTGTTASTETGTVTGTKDAPVGRPGTASAPKAGTNSAVSKASDTSDTTAVETGVTSFSAGVLTPKADSSAVDAIYEVTVTVDASGADTTFAIVAAT